MSSNLQPSICVPLARRCRMSQRMAQAAVQGMCAPAAAMSDRMVSDRMVAKRQIVGNNPIGGHDPMEVPDL